MELTQETLATLATQSAGIIHFTAGQVQAIKPDGSRRSLQFGDTVFRDEIIVTGTDGVIHIDLIDGEVLELGNSDEINLLSLFTDEDPQLVETLVETLEANIEEAELSEAQQAILAGADPQSVLPAPTAGEQISDGNQGNGGFSSQEIMDLSGLEGNPQAGIVTQGEQNNSESQNQSTQDDLPFFNSTPTLTLVSATVIENEAAQGTIVASFIAQDEDGTPTVDFTPGTNGEGYYELDGTNIVLTEGGAQYVNEGGSLPPVSVTATDDTDSRLSGVATVTPTVTPTNDAPIASPDQGVTDENQTLIIDVLANDSDEDVADNPDNFSLDSVNIINGNNEEVSGQGSVSVVNNQLQFVPGSDFDYLAPGETATVTVRYVMSDNEGVTSESVVTIEVTGTNDKPLNLQLDSSSVAENVAGAVIGNLRVNDPDEGDTRSYEISDDRFEVVNDQLKLKAGESLDHESEETVSVTVKVTDSGYESTESTFEIVVDDVNEVPALQLSNRVASLPEDRDTSSRIKIADITVNDDALGTNKLLLTGSHADLFEIHDGDLYLKANVALDHETLDQLDVTVEVDDEALGSGSEASETLQLGVSDVNEAPALQLSNRVASLPEDRDTSSRIKIADITVNDDALGTNKLLLTGSHAELFEIHDGDLYLKANVALDHETLDQLDVTVEVDDEALGSGSEASETLQLGVSDVNEAPALQLSNRVASLPEDRDTSSRIKIADITVNDDALGTNKLLLTGSHADLFEIHDGDLYLKANVALDHETLDQLDVTVEVDDEALGSGSEASETLQLGVSDVNEAPALQLSNRVASLPEDRDTSSRIKIADITVNDDALGTNKLLLTGSHADLFEIHDGDLYLKANVALDHETLDQLDVTVEVDDEALGSGSEASETLQLGVSDVNEAPALQLSNRVASLPEDRDTSSRIKIADITVNDDALGTNKLLLTGSHAELFEIHDGDLYLKANVALDHETLDQLDVTVEVDDEALGSGSEASETLQLGVSDVNEAPALQLSNRVASLPEDRDTSSRIKIADITVNDDALGTNKLLLTGSHADLFEIHDGDLYLKANVALDHETLDQLDVTVEVDDEALGSGSEASETLQLGVSDVNEAPALQLSNRVASLPEDRDTSSRIKIADITVNDDALGTNKLLLTGSHAELFEIHDGDLYLKANVALDHETLDQLDVTVEVDDEALGSGSEASETLQLGVSDVNEAPALQLSNRVASLPEDRDTSSRIKIADITVNDDALGTNKLLLTGSHAELFEIHDGDLYLKANVALDHETLDQLDVTVEVDDEALGSGSEASETLQLGVSDVNEAPALQLSNRVASLPEDRDTSSRIKIADITVNDDALGTNKLLLTGSHADLFEIHDGDLYLKANVALDHETLDQLDVTVEVDDEALGSGSEASETLQLGVSDVNEAPALQLSNRVASLPEDRDTSSRIKIADITVNDDALGTNKLLLTGSHADLFEIHDGDLYLKANVALDHETLDQLDVTVEVDDEALGSGSEASETLQLGVSDVNEAPALQLSNRVASLPEDRDTSSRIKIADITVNDDALGTNKLLLTGSHADLFEIHDGDLYLKANVALDHETLDQLDVTVEVDDEALGSGSEASETLQLGVSDVNEAPALQLSNRVASLPEDRDTSSRIKIADITVNDDALGTNKLLLTGSHAELFEIHDGDLYLKANVALDHETLDQLDVTVEVDDEALGSGSEASETLQLGVSDVNEAPALQLSNRVASLPEDRDTSSRIKIADITVNDDALGTNKLLLTGSHADLFEIHDGDLYLKANVALDHETLDQLDVTVEVDDEALGSGSEASETLQLGVSDVNEAPALQLSNRVASLPEDRDTSSRIKIADITVNDDALGTNKLLLTGSHADLFEIHDGDLYLKANVALDHETLDQLDVTVEVDDEALGSGSEASETLQLGVSDVNEAPALQLSNRVASLPEDRDTSSRIKIADITVNDDALGTNKLLLTGSHAELFEIHDGDLYLKANVALDHETLDQLDVTVEVDDEALGSGSEASETLQLGVSDVNEAPALQLSNRVASLPEDRDTSSRIKIADITVNDDALGTNKLLLTGSHAELFEIHDGDLYLKANVALNHETLDQLDVTVEVDDEALGSGSEASETLQLGVSDVNEAPALQLSNRVASLPEDRDTSSRIKIADITVNDDALGTNKLLLTGSHAELFEIHDGDLYLKANVALDHETLDQLDVTVEVDDEALGSGSEASETLQLGVSDVNEAPALQLSNRVASLPEDRDTSSRIKIADITVNDDALGTNKLLLTGSHADLFEIHDGDLYLKANVALDHETLDQLDVTVEVDDEALGSGSEASETLQLGVSDVNEAPALQLSNRVASLPEDRDTSSRIKIADITVNDDALGTNKLLLTGSHAELFEIHDGDLYLKANVALDHETLDQLDVTVEVDDEALGSGSEASETLQLGVSDVNEAPALQLSNRVASLPEDRDTSSRIKIADITVNDDALGTNKLLLTGSHADLFEIHDGDLYLKANVALDHETLDQLDVTVEVDDEALGSGSEASETLQLGVSDVNEAPALQLSNRVASLPEDRDTSSRIKIADITVNDDALGTNKLLLTGSHADLFEIHDGDLYLKANVALDHETLDQLDVTVEVDDEALGSGSEASETLQLGVSDVNEAPALQLSNRVASLPEDRDTSSRIKIADITVNDDALGTNKLLLTGSHAELFEIHDGDLYLKANVALDHETLDQLDVTVEVDDEALGSGSEASETLQLGVSDVNEAPALQLSNRVASLPEDRDTSSRIKIADITVNDDALGTNKLLLTGSHAELFEIHDGDLYLKANVALDHETLDQLDVTVEVDDEALGSGSEASETLQLGVSDVNEAPALQLSNRVASLPEDRDTSSRIKIADITVNDDALGTNKLLLTGSHAELFEIHDGDLYLKANVALDHETLDQLDVTVEVDDEALGSGSEASETLQLGVSDVNEAPALQLSNRVASLPEDRDTSSRIKIADITVNDDALGTNKLLLTGSHAELFEIHDGDLYLKANVALDHETLDQLDVTVEVDDEALGSGSEASETLQLGVSDVNEAPALQLSNRVASLPEDRDTSSRIKIADITVNDDALGTNKLLLTGSHADLFEIHDGDLYLKANVALDHETLDQLDVTVEVDDEALGSGSEASETLQLGVSDVNEAPALQLSNRVASLPEDRDTSSRIKIADITVNDDALGTNKLLLTGSHADLFEIHDGDLYLKANVALDHETLDQLDVTVEVDDEALGSGSEASETLQLGVSDVNEAPALQLSNRVASLPEDRDTSSRIKIADITVNDDALGTNKLLLTGSHADLFEIHDGDLYLKANVALDHETLDQLDVTVEVDDEALGSGSEASETLQLGVSDVNEAPALQLSNRVASLPEDRDTSSRIKIADITVNDDALGTNKLLLTGSHAELFEIHDGDLYLKANVALDHETLDQLDVTVEVDDEALGSGSEASETLQLGVSDVNEAPALQLSNRVASLPEDRDTSSRIKIADITVNDDALGTNKLLLTGSHADLFEIHDGDLYLKANVALDHETLDQLDVTVEVDDEALGSGSEASETLQLGVSDVNEAPALQLSNRVASLPEDRDTSSRIKIADITVNDDALGTNKLLLTGSHAELFEIHDGDLYLKANVALDHETLDQLDVTVEVDDEALGSGSEASETLQLGVSDVNEAPALQLSNRVASLPEDRDTSSRIKIADITVNDDALGTNKLLLTGSHAELFEIHDGDLYLKANVALDHETLDQLDVTVEVDDEALGSGSEASETLQLGVSDVNEAPALQLSNRVASLPEDRDTSSRIKIADITVNDDALGTNKLLLTGSHAELFEIHDGDLYLKANVALDHETLDQLDVTVEVDDEALGSGSEASETLQLGVSDVNEAPALQLSNRVASLPEDRDTSSRIKIADITVNDDALGTNKLLLTGSHADLFEIHDGDLYLKANVALDHETLDQLDVTVEVDDEALGSGSEASETLQLGVSDVNEAPALQLSNRVASLPEDRDTSSRIKIADITVNDDALGTNKLLLTGSHAELFEIHDGDLYLKANVALDHETLDQLDVTVEVDDEALGSGSEASETLQLGVSDVNEAPALQLSNRVASLPEDRDTSSRIKIADITVNDDALGTNKLLLTGSHADLFEIHDGDLYLKANVALDHETLDQLDVTVEVDDEALGSGSEASETLQLGVSDVNEAPALKLSNRVASLPEDRDTSSRIKIADITVNDDALGTNKLLLTGSHAELFEIHDGDLYLKANVALDHETLDQLDVTVEVDDEALGSGSEASETLQLGVSDVNEAPALQLSNRVASLPEDRDTSSRIKIADITVNDDALGTNKLLLTGSHADLFEIHDGDLYLKANVALDHETLDQLDVTVEVDDEALGSGSEASETLQLGVSDVNEAPALQLSNRVASLPEDRDTSSRIKIADITVNDDALGTNKLLLTGSHADLFEIHDGDLYLKANVALDHETLDQLDVTVEVDDEALGSGSEASETLQLGVSDVNEAPALQLSNRVASLPEDRDTSSRIKIADITVNDDALGTNKLLLTGSHAELFEIHDGDLYLKANVALDHETLDQLDVTVEVDDEALGSGSEASETLQLGVSDVNEAPALQLSNRVASLPEDRDTSSRIKIADITVNDDALGTNKLLLTGSHADLFEIHDGDLYLKANVALDHETLDQLDVTVEVDDEALGSGSEASETLQLGVSDVNEAPALQLSNRVASLPEDRDTSSRIKIADITVNDDALGTNKLLLTGSHADLFEIHDGDLYLKANVALDHETLDQLDVTVEVDDEALGSGSEASETLQLGVSDVNEAPALQLSNRVASLPEDRDTSSRIKIADITVNDDALGTNKLLLTGSHADLFEIHDGDLYLKANVALDHETLDQLDVTVEVDDEALGSGSEASETLQLGVSDVNEAPALQLSNRVASLPEDRDTSSRIKIADITVNDDALGTNKLLLTGSHAELFEIHDGDLYLKANVALDHETLDQLDVTVEVDDEALGSGSEASETLQLGVSDVNEAPALQLSNRVASLPEDRDTSSRIKIADITVNDDALGTNKLLLTGSHAELFEIHDGDLYLKANVALDHETLDQLDVTVEVDDEALGSGSEASETLQLGVSDVNEAPALQLSNRVASLPEDRDTSSRIKIADITVNDDALGTNKLLLTGSHAELFEIHDGDLYLKANVALDHETLDQLDVTVEVDDEALGSGSEASETLQLGVSDVNEAPALQLSNRVASLPEDRDTSSRIKIADITVNDDALGTNKLLLTGSHAELFEIHDGDLYLKANVALDHETLDQLDVTVEVDDEALGSGSEASETLQLGVSDVNEAPALQLSNRVASLPEDRDTSSRIKIADITVNDDALGTNKLLLTGSHADLFEIHDGDLYLKANVALDHETLDQLDVTVEVDDEALGSGSEASETLQLGVSDVNEAPALQLSNRVASLPEDRDTSSRIKIADITVNDDALGTNKLLLTGSHADLFEIHDGDLYLKANVALDHETLDQLDVTVEVDDEALGSGSEASETLQLGVSDVNEAPALQLSNRVASLPEDRDTSSRIKIADITVNDDALGTNKLLLTGSHADLFEIHDGDLYLKANVALDHETLDQLDVTVEVDDEALGSGSEASETLQLGVSDVNEAPALQLSNRVASLPEDRDTSSRIKIADITVNDDALGTNKLLLTGSHADLFEIHDGDLYLKANVALDHETLDQLDVTVEVDDEALGSGSEASETLQLGVSDVNEAPALQLSNRVASLPEDRDTSSRIKIADITVNDDALGTNKLLLTGSHAELFEIHDGDLYLKANVALDHETLDQLDVTVEVDDEALGSGSEASETLQLGVSDVNEAPALQLSNRVASLPEDRDTSSRIKIADITVNDDALGTNKLLLTGSHAELFEIHDGDLYLKANVALDHETLDQLDVTVEVDDEALGSGSEASETLQLGVSDVNEAPALQLSNRVASLPEDRDTSSRIKIADITVNDDALGTNKLLLTGSHAELFEIHDGDLYLKANVALDHETLDQLDVTVEVDDEALGSGSEASETLQLGVSDVNEAPALQLSNRVASLPEDRDTSSRIKIADITVNDDALGTNKLLLTGSHADLFEIHDGDLYLKANVALDHETLDQLDVTVEVDDEALGSGSEASETLQLGVSDVNEAPALQLSNRVASLPEDRDTSSRIKIADITVNDDALGTNKLLLTGSHADLFEIHDGDLYLKANVALDHETLDQLDVTVEVDDEALGSGSEASESLEIAVGDVNEPPTGQNFSIKTSTLTNGGKVGIDFTDLVSDIEDDDGAVQIMLTSLPDEGSLVFIENGVEQVVTGAMLQGGVGERTFSQDELIYKPANATGLLGHDANGDNDHTLQDWGQGIASASQPDSGRDRYQDDTRQVAFENNVTATIIATGGNLKIYEPKLHIGNGLGVDEGYWEYDEGEKEDYIAEQEGVKGITPGESISVRFSEGVSYVEVGLDGMGGHFQPKSPDFTNAHAAWTAYDSNGNPIGSGKIFNTDTDGDMTEQFVIDSSMTNGKAISTIEFTTGSENNCSSYEILYLDVGFTVKDGFTYVPVDSNGAVGEEQSVSVEVNPLNFAGSAGHDVLIGSSVADAIAGGAGEDRITGGAGNDRLQGGEDSDTFVFQSSDLIDGQLVQTDQLLDFTLGDPDSEAGDKLDLSGLIDFDKASDTLDPATLAGKGITAHYDSVNNLATLTYKKNTSDGTDDTLQIVLQNTDGWSNQNSDIDSVVNGDDVLLQLINDGQLIV